MDACPGALSEKRSTRWLTMHEDVEQEVGTKQPSLHQAHMDSSVRNAVWQVCELAAPVLDRWPRTKSSAEEWQVYCQSTRC